MKLRVIMVLCIILIGATAGALTTQPLFFIERTLNANIVRFDAQLNHDGTLDPREPVIAYWLMNAEDGRRESLNFVERKIAYGFSVTPVTEPGRYHLSIVSFSKKPIMVFTDSDIARAVTDINGSPSFLDRVFIKATGAMSKPEFVEFHGRDIKTGEVRTERVYPD